MFKDWEAEEQSVIEREPLTESKVGFEVKVSGEVSHNPC